MARFDAVVKAVRPYLWCVNLDGMRPEGPKIPPFGTGTHDRKMLQAVVKVRSSALTRALH